MRNDGAMTDQLPPDVDEPGAVPASFTFEFAPGQMYQSGDVPMHTDHAQMIIDALRGRFGGLLPDVRDHPDPAPDGAASS